MGEDINPQNDSRQGHHHKLIVTLHKVSSLDFITIQGIECIWRKKSYSKIYLILGFSTITIGTKEACFMFFFIQYIIYNFMFNI